MTPAMPAAPVVEAPVAPTTPTAPDAPVARPATIAEVTPAAPVPESPVAKSPAAPVVEAPAAKSEVASAKPVFAGKRTAAPEEVVVIDLSQESARAAAPLREAPFVAAAQQEIAAATASARTESIIEVVNNVAEAIADQILVTPSLVRGEGQMIVRLKPEVLDGSEIHLSSESGTLAVEIVPSTQNAAKLATEAMPRLETALAEHVATFRQVSVSVRKGKVNETV
jgi:flagellar hook-length control protein FliK